MALFDSFTLNDIYIKNRIVVPPSSDNAAQRDGRLSSSIADYIKRVVRQGAGTVILDSAYVTKQGRNNGLQLGLSDENHIPRLKNLIKNIKIDNVFCGIRLSHAGAKTNEKFCGEQPIGPSAINFGKDYDLSRSFDEDDVDELCLFYSHAIERAEEIGFDFIELNAGQQQLLDQCLHVRYNSREDHYGQSLVNRLRLSCRIVEAMKSRVKGKILISYFFPIHDKLEDGFDKNDLEEMLKILEAAGVDIFHPVTIHVMNKFFESECTLLEWVTKFTPKPVIVEGNIKSTSVLKEILSVDQATMYGLDKALFIRPNWYQFLQKKMSI